MERHLAGRGIQKQSIGVIEAARAGRVTLTPEEERWAEAAAIHRQHGDGSRVWVAQRIGALALTGDMAGIDRMQEIAAWLDQIMRATEQ